MRLLNATTFEIGSFADDQIPPYAILSHTWASQTSEVSFHDVHGATAPIGDGGSFKEKTGWAKIEGACAQSLARGCEHIWIDTCCVDKSSSAELQESINSMFRWYAGAEICLAFLSDVPGTAAEDVDVGAEDSFRRARWFTRGWTLQELLAPTTVEFFNRDWKSLGTKDSLSEVIQDITGIPPQYLCWDSLGIWGMGSGHERLSRASVADRMSWAAGRQTTRSEDMAYCLLGLFGVYMPMLYGEGDRAFARLQEEIMKETDDCTLLSWGYAQLWNDRADTRTILAPNPAAFEHCGGLVPRRLEGFSRPWFSLGQQGLALSLPVKDDRKYGCVVYAILACGPSVSTGSLVAVPL
ncbi:heterokaryon incompatibility protein-domain-containing protein, partial [Lasiosphaeria hispida]